MTNGKIACFLVLLQVLFADNRLGLSKSDSFLLRLVNQTNSSLLPGDERLEPVRSNISGAVPFMQTLYQCKGNCPGNDNEAQVQSPRQGRRAYEFARFSSGPVHEMAGVVGKKTADFDVMTDDQEESVLDYNGTKETEDEDDEKEEEEEEEDEGDDGEDDDEYDFSLLGNDEKPSKKKTTTDEDDDDDDDDEEDDTPQLKHLFKKKLKMKDIMFLLLLAYKLKFVTLIPLFLGALILLVGTTSMAGFFFALFSAALGLQSKSHH